MAYSMNDCLFSLLTRLRPVSMIVLGVTVWGFGFFEGQTQAQDTLLPKLVVTVTSAEDGAIATDQHLTLREAIELINGTLALESLSPAERQNVRPSSANAEIRFNLPAGQTKIALESLLPAISQPGVTIDGTSQPGYDATQSATAEIAVAIPIVEITAANSEVFRGLTLVADNITIKGLSLYGFTSAHRATETTPPADIFIAHRLPPPDISEQQPPATYFSFGDDDIAPQGIVITQNWLGIPPDERLPEQPSAFGVSVFNSTGAKIHQNRIAYHDGSGIITGARAENLHITENLIVNNGLAGMPDAIRLDGRIENGLIQSNLICGNDGSGIFLFKPEGAVTITDNAIRLNGQRLRRSAIYLMGNNHQVTHNRIEHQKGPGVVVTAYSQGGNTQSYGNVIEHNFFSSLEGLSIDLNSRRHGDSQHFQQGDGPNPMRDSVQRRRDTGNSAINAPQFLDSSFFRIDGRVVIEGMADPGSQVQLYRTSGAASEFGPLSEPLATVTVDETGRFSYAATGLVSRDRISAITTDPRYGTSEPALNATILDLGESIDATTANNTKTLINDQPACTTPPPVTEISPPIAVVPPPETPIILEVPRNVHFGLDEDFINPESHPVLDRIVAAMQTYPTLVVDLHGHTDSRASVAYNEDLARRRANNTRRYLIQQGIAPERITIRSLGETQLRVTETDRANYARNRRVEFVFQDARGLPITLIDQEEDLQIEP
jgi:outer membrane protein OmpA-like peptidoglycan-associated protein